MTAAAALAGPAALLLLFASCRPAEEQVHSLVGAEELPAAAALSKEIIYISRGYGEVSTGFLSYELRPDDLLVVTHEDRDRDKVIGEEKFRLESGVADKARRALWRLRPEKLEGIDSHEARPAGCERRGPHDFGELAVSFISAGHRPGVEDDLIGGFELPTAESCGSPQAVEARRVVREAMALFPASKVAEGFETRDR
jgi:hypothetical protein